MSTRFPVGRASAIAALAVGAFLVTQHAADTRWRTLRPGLEFTTLRGEPWCRSGSAALGVLRVDAARAPLRVRHCSLEPEGRPLDILEWQRRSGAIAVFNAGQYYPDLRYMGLLASGGNVVSRRAHPKFQAALVAGPRVAGSPARILDLALEPLDPDTLAWAEVAQSYMLFDRQGRVRVRRSDQVANRTAVGEDGQGRIVVVVSEGGYTLWEFAKLMQSLPLGLRQAMAMDGGREAELVVSAGGFRYASFGDWPKSGANDAALPRVELPAVVTVGAQ
jgi:hypothetical protein